MQIIRKRKVSIRMGLVEMSGKMTMLRSGTSFMAIEIKRCKLVIIANVEI